jgi:hypothetical protein
MYIPIVLYTTAFLSPGQKEQTQSRPSSKEKIRFVLSLTILGFDVLRYKHGTKACKPIPPISGQTVAAVSPCTKYIFG